MTMARRDSNASRIAAAGAVYFALVFGTGFVLGSVRVPVLVPLLGERTAELLEMPFMLVAVVLAARFICRRFAVPPRAAPRLGAGLAGLVLLVGAELLLAALLQHRSPAAYIASRDPVSGTAFACMLVLFGFMPFVLARVQRVRDRHVSSGT